MYKVLFAHEFLCVIAEDTIFLLSFVASGSYILLNERIFLKCLFLKTGPMANVRFPNHTSKYMPSVNIRADVYYEI